MTGDLVTFTSGPSATFADPGPGGMVAYRNGHTATLLTTGKVLLVGGDDYDTSPTAEIFH